ncbi:efflux RND transporter periplasmic adaptor subunit [Denitratisoma sp. agr-D3]
MDATVKLRLLPFALLGLAACSSPPPPEVQPRLVKSIVVGQGGEATGPIYSGEVRARRESLLGFRIGGKIVERLVDAGAVVKAGQPLARIDGADAALQVVQAEAQRSLAEAEARRYRDLKEKNFISQSALDGKETTLKAAAAQAALARNQAAYTTLVADRDGVIAAVLAEVGQVVSAGQGVMRLAQKGEREVALNIPEEGLTGLKPGVEAEVTLWAGERRAIQGKLRELAPAADPATRTYPARIALPPAEAALPLGLSATVKFVGTSSAARDAGKQFSIPLGAVFQDGDKPAVWVIDKDGMLSLRPVGISRYGEREAVVNAGLEGGERLVAAGVHKLHGGEKVRLVDAAQAR